MILFKNFKINREYYLYDTNSNKLVNIDFSSYEFIEHNFMNIKNNNLKHCNNLPLRKLQRKGLLLNNKISKIEHPLNPLLPSLLDRKLMMLSLQVTQKCNLNCEYCQYSGLLYNNRRHTNLSMKKELAIQTVDFFLKHSVDNKSIYIGFYGGEPLIEFGLIKDITNYVLSLKLNRIVTFTITTNGTLFDENKIAFFVKNNFKISISLDGPQNIHDSHRKDNKGEGSFLKVIRWVTYLKSKYPAFFEKNVIFNSVNYDHTNKQLISDFFIKNGYKVESILLSDFYSKREKSFSDNSIYEKYEKLKLILFLKGYKKFKSIFLSDFIFAKRIMNTMMLTNKNLPNVFHPSGPCIPGVKRLFVNVNGRFYPCERSNELSESLCIGNVDDGFNIIKIFELLNIAKITEKECKNCWAIRFCYSCALSSVDSKTLEISKEKRLSMCKYRKEKILKAFEMILWLQKLGCDWNEI